MSAEPSAVQDSAIRMALAEMAQDATSPLTPAQRDWILDLPKHTQPLTPRQRARLKRPLLAYIEAHRPSIAALVRRQFDPSNGEETR